MFSKLVKLEGFLLTGAGLAHLVYAGLYLDWSAFPFPASLGATLFGVAYTIFGLLMLFGKTFLLIPTLVVNALGLTAVLVVREASPFWPIDPYLIMVDLVSIPLLIWLIWANWKAKR